MQTRVHDIEASYRMGNGGDHGSSRNKTCFPPQLRFLPVEEEAKRQLRGNILEESLRTVSLVPSNRQTSQCLSPRPQSYTTLRLETHLLYFQETAVHATQSLIDISLT